MNCDTVLMNCDTVLILALTALYSTPAQHLVCITIGTVIFINPLQLTYFGFNGPALHPSSIISPIPTPVNYLIKLPLKGQQLTLMSFVLQPRLTLTALLPGPALSLINTCISNTHLHLRHFLMFELLSKMDILFYRFINAHACTINCDQLIQSIELERKFFIYYNSIETYYIVWSLNMIVKDLKAREVPCGVFVVYA